MSTEIERLLYYERQYLRSFDFIAEQSYHLEMRRRLNMNLHTWGIVEGLELLRREVVSGVAEEEVCVSEGMAIDAYGREIIVPSVHPLSEFLDQNPLSGTGVYSVWIGYTREPSSPPEAGYRRCELQDQFTRWRESFAIRLCKVGTGEPGPQYDPQLFDAPLDDSQKYPWWIQLGTVLVDKNSTFINPTNEGRCYIGVRAQRIVAPREVTEFAVLAKNDSLSPYTSVGVEANLFAERNLIVGTDFEVKTTAIIPSPPPQGYPSLTGNVKIASDLFVQGDLYTQCDRTQPGHWLNLDQCIRERIKEMVPETQIGTTDSVPFTATWDAPHTFIAKIDVPVTTQLAQAATEPPPRIITSICGVNFKAPRQAGMPGRATELHSAPMERGSAAGTGLSIEAVGKVSPPSGNQYSLTLTCTVGPLPNLGIDTFSIVSVKFSYVVIFYPQT